MGITEKLYIFCNFRASCRITAPAVFKIVSQTFCIFSDFNIDIQLWFLNIELFDTSIVTFSYCWWTIHVLFNKSEWTISIKVVFLVFVLVVAAKEFAKNMMVSNFKSVWVLVQCHFVVPVLGHPVRGRKIYCVIKFLGSRWQHRLKNLFLHKFSIFVQNTLNFNTLLDFKVMPF